MATCNPSELISDAACFQCLSNKELKAVIAQLLCNISQGGAGDCDDRIVITSDTVGVFCLTASTTVTSISFPNATAFNQSLETETCLNVAGCSNLISFSAPQVQTAQQDFNINSMPLLSVLDIHSIVSVPGFFVLNYLDVLASINLPNLTSAGAIFFDNNALLTTLNVPLLSTVSTDVAINVNPLLTSISLSSLVSIGGAFAFDNNTAMTSIDMPLMTTYVGAAGTGIVANTCPNLTTFNAPNIIFSAGAGVVVDFNGCALNQTSVEQILSRGVATGGGGGAIMDLSGGTNFGQAGLSPAGAADLATLLGNGWTVLMNP